MTDDSGQTLLRVGGLTRYYGARVGCRDVNFELFPGEVIGIVGEPGSGKTTVLNCLSARLEPTAGTIEYAMRAEGLRDIYRTSEPERRLLGRTDWGFVHQNPRDGLRMEVSAGANVGERLMAMGARHYGRIRGAARDWLERVEIDLDRLDDLPATFSGGMLQRLQIARNLVSGLRLVFMDEPTGGLDVSVQARLLDLMRGLVGELGVSAVIVTHDLAVARLLAHRLMVMRHGEVVESGLTDQVLDDPQHPYTQLLVSSILLPWTMAANSTQPARPPRLAVEGLGKSFVLHNQGGIRLVSLMDHTPGQGQFTDVERWRAYYRGKYGLSEAEMDATIARQHELQSRYAGLHRARIVGICRAKGLPLASHDDATAAHVDEAVEAGAVIAEFPTTVAAAERARERGHAIMMGGPNLVLGDSHSRNVSAAELAKLGLLDILSSDYVPFSTLLGAFCLAGDEFAVSLPEAVRMVTERPAQAVGLDDRGALRPGLRAELIQVREVAGTPAVRAAWLTGERAA